MRSGHGVYVEDRTVPGEDRNALEWKHRGTQDERLLWSCILKCQVLM